MRRLALLICLVSVSPVAAREAVELPLAQGDAAANVMFCALSTRPDLSLGYAIVAIDMARSVEQPTIRQAVGLTPDEDGGDYAELKEGTVRHVCAAGGASVLAVAVDATTLAAVRALFPRGKDLRRESPYSGAYRAMKLATGVLDALGLKKGYSYARASQGAERSITFFQDLLVLNRPRTPPEEGTP